MKEILVIGGTGAQGPPVVKSLLASKRFAVKVLTRDVNSARAQQIAELPNVNTDGFTLGEKNEMFYGCRAYEIARHKGVQHYGHNDAKGRVADFILAQGQKGAMKSSILTTGPYMDMLQDESGKLPLINLEDVRLYSLWLFNNLSESAGIDLMVATDEVTFEEHIPIEDWLNAAEPYSNASANFVTRVHVHRDEASMIWRENFTPWWKYWGEGVCQKRDFKLLDRIYPTRVKNLED
ncbi:hypothetical protein DL95DRAFT_428890 [Leptodontidium sp. 2 PMI_412]|nr:hypothetical protein DL95DRAFT_428890 [Leptodontidium sp. 2 PMI_412]